MSKGVARILAITISLALGSSAFAAQDPQDGDVRDIKIGSRVTELSMQSYAGLRCADSEQPLERWSDFRRCAPDSRGLHAIRFEFLPSNPALAQINDRWEGTKIAGHPVLLALWADAKGEVQAIRIETDPEARPYLKKKAFLLGLRVRERYGEDGWQCSDRPRQGAEGQVGGMFIRRTCEKLAQGRRLVLETKLYREAGQTGRDFVSSTRFEIMRAGF